MLVFLLLGRWEFTHRCPNNKKKIAEQMFCYLLLNFVGVTRFELATTRPPDVYSNRAELHPELCRSKTLVRFRSANIVTFFILLKFFVFFFDFCRSINQNYFHTAHQCGQIVGKI